MSDLSKIADKFNLQGIIDNVKSMISPVPIPEASKGDPVGYYMSEMNKVTKEIAEMHAKQADAIAKLSATLGSLYQEVMNSRKAQGGAGAKEAAIEKPAEAQPKAEG